MRKRYAIVGLGDRSHLYTRALLTTYREHGELVSVCDTNQTRMDYWNRRFTDDYESAAIPTYQATDFGSMLTEQDVQTVIITSIDRTHHEYIIAALRAGCDVITEKPMTIDAAKCQAILDAQRETGRQVRVTFNYRYALHNTAIKELLAAGAIGEVLSVHFEWLLDTRHGADYFRRWHRERANSGGLLVHKAAHHFDLMNWWLADRPTTVFALGRLGFYGADNAARHGIATSPAERLAGTDAAWNDPWAIDLDANSYWRDLYRAAEHEDGYYRDRNVFGEQITIEDDAAVVVRYARGAIMSYHLTAYAPWEGFRVGFNGTLGRLEVELVESGSISDSRGEQTLPEPYASAPPVAPPATRFLLRPHWGAPREISVALAAGGHGGGDERLLADLFAPTTPPDPWHRAANHLDGALALLPGIAANQAIATGNVVQIQELVRF